MDRICGALHRHLNPRPRSAARQFPAAAPLRSAGLAAGLLLAGCTQYSDTFMKVQGATYVPRSISQRPQLPAAGIKGLTIRAFNALGKEQSSFGDNEEALYLTVDVSPILGGKSVTLAERNALMDTLMLISDRNCNLFLSRMYAANVHVRAGKGFLNHLLATATAGTAPFLAPAATGLAATNVFAGGIAEQYENTYLAGKTTDAIEAAILTVRARLRTELLKNRELGLKKYSAVQMLHDLEEYDTAASLKTAFRELQKTQEAALATAENGKPKTDGSSQNSGTNTSNGAKTDQANTTPSPSATPTPSGQ